MPRPPAEKLELYAEVPSPRLRYVAQTLARWFEIDVEVSPRRAERSAPGAPERVARIHYTVGTLPGDHSAHSQSGAGAGDTGVPALHIAPEGVLGEDSLEPRRLEPGWGSFAGIDNPVGDDPLAGAFYLLSAYPEYLTEARDQHGRVPAAAHPYVRRGHARVPLADRLLRAVLEAACTRAGLACPPWRRERPRSTLDLDLPRAAAGKSMVRVVAGGARALLAGRWSDAPRLLASGLAGRPDPFDTFGWLRAEHVGLGLRPIAYLLMGYATARDPGFEPTDPRWPSLLAQLDDWSEVGLHPSYGANVDAGLATEELARLRALAAPRPITRTRQHYLRVAWPATLRIAEAAGLAEDASLGWPERLGFRLGTARTVAWYDLERERTSGLALAPPHAMDVTARLYEGLTPAEFIEVAAGLDVEARCSGGGLHLIWHNSNLGPLHGWGPWRAAYQRVLRTLGP